MYDKTVDPERGPHSAHAAQTMATGSGPLSDLTVLEVSSVVMAPLAGRMLAKLGADVIRVEPPLGDVIRRTGASRNPGMSGAHLSLGDGKRNIAIDMRTAKGLAELRQLIEMADIVVTNYLPRRRAEFGLDWKSVRAINPAAILCTAQGYASSSELADTPAYDDTVQAATGTCDIYAKLHGTPQFAPYIMADKVGGLTIVYSVLAALHFRDQTGQGQWVDVPMVDVVADFNMVEQLNDYTFMPPLGEAGWHRTLAPTRKPHLSQDGWICILPYSDRNWIDFLKLAGIAATETSSVLFPTNRDRNENMEAVQGIIADYTAARSVGQIVDECEARGIPVQQVKTIESLVDDPYLRSRGTVEIIEHPTEGTIWRTTPNIGFSESPLTTTRPAGGLDQDREAILSMEHDNPRRKNHDRI